MDCEERQKLAGHVASTVARASGRGVSVLSSYQVMSWPWGLLLLYGVFISHQERQFIAMVLAAPSNVAVLAYEGAVNWPLP